MFQFTATTEGSNKLRLRKSLEEYAAGYGVPANVDAETAAAIVLDAFKRQVRAELELPGTCLRQVGAASWCSSHRASFPQRAASCATALLNSSLVVACLAASSSARYCSLPSLGRNANSSAPSRMSSCSRVSISDARTAREACCKQERRERFRQLGAESLSRQAHYERTTTILVDTRPASSTGLPIGAAVSQSLTYIAIAVPDDRSCPATAGVSARCPRQASPSAPAVLRHRRRGSTPRPSPHPLIALGIPR